MDYLPWVEKYRPKTIEEIISHHQNILTIKKLLENNSLPHLLFHGSPGTGKTSTIMALANEIYSFDIKLMTMKLDASDDRGINSVRDDIKGFAEKSNMFKRGVKLVILDEADAMTFDAQFALRRIIEKYSESLRFCLICNYENKIIPAIRSRCANFRFGNIDINHIYTKLNQIVQNENLKVEGRAIEIISKLSKGDLRKAINLLQSISSQNNNYITEDLCYETVGVPNNKEINELLSTLMNKKIKFKKAWNQIWLLIKNNGWSLSVILKELILEMIDKLDNSMINYISELSDLENAVSKSTFGDIYITNLIAIFKQ